jgi:hypothetical protein
VATVQEALMARRLDLVMSDKEHILFNEWLRNEVLSFESSFILVLPNARIWALFRIKNLDEGTAGIERPALYRGVPTSTQIGSRPCYVVRTMPLEIENDELWSLSRIPRMGSRCTSCRSRIQPA